jgi:hypothetical protein
MGNVDWDRVPVNYDEVGMKSDGQLYAKGLGCDVVVIYGGATHCHKWLNMEPWVERRPKPTVGDVVRDECGFVGMVVFIADENCLLANGNGFIWTKVSNVCKSDEPVRGTRYDGEEGVVWRYMDWVLVVHPAGPNNHRAVWSGPASGD